MEGLHQTQEKKRLSKKSYFQLDQDTINMSLPGLEALVIHFKRKHPYLSI